MNKSSVHNEFLYKSVEALKREALERDHASLTIPEAESLLHRHLRLEAEVSVRNSVERRLIALEQRPVCQQVTSSEPYREYYEQKIEEISAKRLETSEVECRAMADTISELREELEAIDVNGIYHDRMQARLEADKAQVEVTQLKAIIAEKNREIEGLRYKEAK